MNIDLDKINYLLDEVTDEYKNMKLGSILKYKEVYNIFVDIIQKHYLDVDKKFGLPQFNVIRIADDDSFNTFEKYGKELMNKVEKETKYRLEYQFKELDSKAYVLYYVKRK